ncbi:hypothetical protein [Rubrivirga sp.]|uniref:hypothetical protein n=1 Tax=Rubrivirga sp. TaxID=1885344 RepID=UPI003C7666A6
MFAFRERAGRWVLEAELRLSDVRGGSQYGFSVAASGDRIAVGDVGRAASRGSVFVWVRRPSGEWDLEAELWPAGLGRRSARASPSRATGYWSGPSVSEAVAALSTSSDAAPTGGRSRKRLALEDDGSARASS